MITLRHRRTLRGLGGPFDMQATVVTGDRTVQSSDAPTQSVQAVNHSYAAIAPLRQLSPVPTLYMGGPRTLDYSAGATPSGSHPLGPPAPYSGPGPTGPSDCPPGSYYSAAGGGVPASCYNPGDTVSGAGAGVVAPLSASTYTGPRYGQRSQRSSTSDTPIAAGSGVDAADQLVGQAHGDSLDVLGSDVDSDVALDTVDAAEAAAADAAAAVRRRAASSGIGIGWWLGGAALIVGVVVVLTRR
jgi:hypothetical protein